jgi:cytochrome c oxidase assembly factor CtaG
MHPLTRELLSGWEFRPEVLAILVPLGVMYFVGWRRLRRHSAQHKLANGWRLASYLGGLGIIALALMSPIDRLGGQLFFMHMVQHMLMIMFAAPMLLMADPFPFFLWSLPLSLRRPVAMLFERDSLFRRGLIKVTQPGVAWLIFLTVYLGWHDPKAYNAALYYEWVHNLQHITFFLASLIYWWPLVGCAPHIHPRFPGWGKLAYLVGTIPPNMAIGVSIAFASEIMYTYYLSVPRVWGFTALQDQQLAGAIMWIQGSEMYIMVTLFFLGRLFMTKGKGKPVERAWDTEDAMIAPGLEDRVSQNRWNKVANSNTTDISQDISQPT